MNKLFRIMIISCLLASCKNTNDETVHSDVSAVDSTNLNNAITNEDAAISYAEIIAIEKDLQPSYYVSSQGNDENSGRAVGNSFRTLSRAIEIATQSATKRITIIGTLNDETEKNDSSESVFSLSYKGETEITISGIPEVSSKLQARLSAIGTRKRVVECQGKIRFENLEIRDANTEVPGAGISGNFFILGENAKIINNRTTNDGGGIYEGNGCIIEKGAIISNNSARNGGGIYLSYSWHSILNNGGDITNNTASECGGGVYILNARNSFVMKDGNISNNVAGNSGGGIYTSDKCELQNVSIKNNIAKNNGAGIFIGWDTGVSSSSSDGGSVYMISCSIINNKSQFGAGIYNQIGELKIVKSSVANNHATYVGGGIYLKNDSSFSQSDSSISNNKADDGQGVEIFDEKNS